LNFVLAAFDQTNLNPPLFGYNIAAGEGAPADVKALFAVAPNTDWYGVGDSVSAAKASVQDCANYAVQNNGDGFIYHGECQPTTSNKSSMLCPQKFPETGNLKTPTPRRGHCEASLQWPFDGLARSVLGQKMQRCAERLPPCESSPRLGRQLWKPCRASGHRC
jgi:hypothetical protein